MYRYTLFILLVGFAVLTPSLNATAFAVESISSFSVEATLNKNGQLDVKESITYDFGTANRHGIFRTIPTALPQVASSWLKKRVIVIENVAVLKDGYDIPFTLKEGSDIEVKIGDPNLTITGPHTYEINYTVDGALFTYETGEVELYWNVTGTNWEVPINEAKFFITGPADAFTDQVVCYQGVKGSTNRCAVNSADALATFSADGLGPYEGMTIAIGINDSVIEVHDREEFNLLFLGLISSLILVIVGAVFMYRSKTKHNPHQTIIPQYEPYPDMLPMYTGVMFDGTLNPQDITAGLLYLAEKGYLKIRRTEERVLYFFEVDDYEVELLKSVDDTSAFLKTITSLLFDYPKVGEKVKLSTLRKDRYKKLGNSKILLQLKKSIENDLKTNGFYERLVTNRQAVVLFGVLLFSLLLFVWQFPPAFILGVVVLVIFLPFTASKRMTRKGYEAYNYLKGFKQFLSVTGKDRFKFHNAPTKDPEQFLEYLPYAVALGVEKEWSEVFSDITIPQPDWYDGGSINTFSATALTSDLGAFSSSFSSSSGSSGSSGGGSSGGGGGGGGGGSW